MPYFGCSITAFRQTKLPSIFNTGLYPSTVFQMAMAATVASWETLSYQKYSNSRSLPGVLPVFLKKVKNAAYTLKHCVLPMPETVVY